MTVARWIETDSLSNQDISAALAIGVYTADADRMIVCDVSLDAVAGNGDYVIYLTRRINGAGSSYVMLPKTTCAAASGETAIGMQSGAITVLSGDVVTCYVKGLAGDDTTPDTIVRWFEMAALRPTTADRTLDVSPTGEAGLDFDNVKAATGATTLTNITVPTVTTVGSVAANGITATSLAADAINAAAIKTGAITNAKFAAGAIDAAAIADNAIDAGAIAADAITAAKIAAGAIDNATFAADVGSTAYATNIIALAADKAIVNAALATAAAVADVPTVAEFEARTLPAADYVVVGDTLAAVTTVGTTTNLTNLPAAAALEATLTAMKGATFSGATDSLEALRDRGDAAWITATGFATAANLATLAGYVDTEVAAILAAVDTEVAAIKAKTDNLPTDPADQSAVEAAITAATSPLATAAALATVAGYVDTEVASILAAVDTEVAAIKAKTDNLPAAPASTTNITAGTITTVTNLTNAATNGDLTATMKTSVTTAATAATPTAAAVTGAVGSVTGAVGSVTGAVGSVTGNVGGNVVGSVGSVSGDTKQTADVATLIATVGVAGAGLTALATQASVDGVPTVAEFEARTLAAASYFDPAADTVARVTLVDTTTTNTDMVAAAPSAATVADAVWDEAIAGHAGAGSTGAALSAATAPSAATVADAVWDELLAGHTDAGSAGAGLAAAGSAGDPWSTVLPGSYGASTAGKIFGSLPGAGSSTQVYTVYQVDGTTPESGVVVRMTTDAAGLVLIDQQISDAAGQVTLRHDLASGTTVYLWRYKEDALYSDPDVEVLP